MFIVLEITTVSDGEDILKLKAYGEGKTEPDWLMTETLEISDTKVSCVSMGYNYCASYSKI